MARRTRASAQVPQTPKKETFFILDKNAEQIAGQNVTAAHKRDGIALTQEEAAFYIASGTIGTENPEKPQMSQKAENAAPDNTVAPAVLGNADDPRNKSVPRGR